MRRLKVAYNRIFRILMGLEHRTSMSAEFIVRDIWILLLLFCVKQLPRLENVFLATIIFW